MSPPNKYFDRSAPKPEHPRLRALWRVIYWRRHRRFMRYLRERVREEIERAYREAGL